MLHLASLPESSCPGFGSCATIVKRSRRGGKGSNVVEEEEEEDVGEEAVIIGGGRGDDSSSSASSMLLRIKFFDVENLLFKPMIINTGGVENRAFHSISTVGGGDIYVFGGLGSSMGELSGELLRISITAKDTCNVHSVLRNTLLERYAGISEVVGAKKDKVVVYGGKSKSGKSLKLPSALFDVKKREITELLIRETGQSPVDRSYHTSAVFGDHKQFVLIQGGIDSNGTPLDDVWVLDMSDIVVDKIDESPITAIAAAAQPDAGKGGKGAAVAKKPPDAKLVVEPTEPSAVWIKVGTMKAPRYLHCTLASMPPSSATGSGGGGNNIHAAVDLLCFGGLSKEQCYHDHKLYKGRCEINLTDKSTKWTDYVLDISSGGGPSTPTDLTLAESSTIGATAVSSKGNIFIFGGDSRFEAQQKVRGHFTSDIKEKIESIFRSPTLQQGGSSSGDDDDNDSISYSISKVSFAK